MQPSPFPRVTPWVGRLIIANAVVLLLLQTVLIAPGIRHALSFSPAESLTQPWTFVTYMFVHADLWHLVMNMFGLFIFGTMVEQRMGPRSFLLFYLYCGIGAAIFSLALSGLFHVGPFVGASGAILGVMVAFATFWPDAEIVPFPFPIAVKAKYLILAFVAIDVLFALLAPAGDGIARFAHIGGAFFGFLFFRIQNLSQRRPGESVSPVQRVVMVQTHAGEVDRAPTPVTPLRARRRGETDAQSTEMDRLLDKISAQGMDSLTADERKFLFEMAQKKKGGETLH